VTHSLLLLSSYPEDQLAEASGLSSWACWQEAERAYLLWKARQVADQRRRGAVVIVGPRGRGGEEQKALMNFAVHELKGDLFADLMEHMGMGRQARGGVIPMLERRERILELAWSVATIYARHMWRWLWRSGE
jgi:hypothetical protein